MTNGVHFRRCLPTGHSHRHEMRQKYFAFHQAERSEFHYCFDFVQCMALFDVVSRSLGRLRLLQNGNRTQGLPTLRRKSSGKAKHMLAIGVSSVARSRVADETFDLTDVQLVFWTQILEMVYSETVVMCVPFLFNTVSSSVLQCSYFQRACAMNSVQSDNYES